MAKYGSAVLWFVIIGGLFYSSAGGMEMDNLTEDDLSELVATTDYVLALYVPNPCKSAECKNAHEQFPLVVESLALPGVKLVVVENAVLTQKLGVSSEPKVIFYRHAAPILYDGLSVEAEQVTAWMEENDQSYTLMLNSHNFEHETQAATGATTGDWFIRFTAPDCNDVTAIWEAVASRLHGRTNVAVVDMDGNEKLEKRFKITRCPSFIFFRHGNMYTYDLPVTSIESFVAFAEGWYKNAHAKPVPAEQTPFDALTDSVVDMLKAKLDPYATYAVKAVIIICLLVLVKFCFFRRKKSKLF